MTLSDRMAALSEPDRAMDAEIAEALDLAWDYSADWRGWGFDETGEAIERPVAYPYLSSIDAALTLASPALQAHTMAEAQKLLGPRGFTVGKFTEALAIAICVVALREKGL